MMVIFPALYLLAFLLGITDFIKGRKDGILLFIIAGLSIYTTALSVTFIMGFGESIIYFQSLKEVFVILVLGTAIWKLSTRIRFHFIDYAILFFFLYTLIYALLPIGDQGLMDRLIAFKSTSFFVLIYCIGRLFKPKEIYVSKYFHYVLLLSIAAACVVMYEVVANQHLQTLTGYADYNFYLFNFEPSGHYGLSWTFESAEGFKRFAGFFANPLELAAATIIALAVWSALYTDDNYRLRVDDFGQAAFVATAICIIFALSRSSFVSYLIVIYVYCMLTKRRLVLKFIHGAMVAGIIYIIFLLTKINDRHDGLQQLIVNTLNFSNPSSVGHLVEWIQGILAMVQYPMGLGLGSSGRVAGSLGENVGGENQFIIIGVQAGVIALIVYLVIYIAIIKTAYKWYPALTGKEKKICLALLLIKIGFIIPSLTSEIESSSYISYFTWFLTGLCMSIIMGKTSTENNTCQSKLLLE